MVSVKCIHDYIAKYPYNIKTRLPNEGVKNVKKKSDIRLLSFVMSNCEVVTFPIDILGQVWYLIVSIPDLCPLSFFGMSDAKR